MVLVIVAGEYLAPRLIGVGYRQEGPGLLNSVFGGRSEHSLDHYVAFWRSTFRLGLLGVAIACALVWAWRWRLGALAVERASTVPQLSPLGVVGLSLWFGALSGLLQAGERTVRHLIEQDPARLFTWEGAWMAPLSSSLAFLLIGLAFLTIAGLVGLRSGPRIPLTVPLVVFILAVPASYGPLQNPRLRLASYAIVILSLGLAAGLTRLSVRPGQRFLRVVNRSTVPLVASLVISTLAGVLTLPSALERRRLADLPAASDRPNVLLIILDTVRAQNLGMYGYGRPTTPNLDRLAGRGVVFDRAIATAPWTLPSHASVFTGRFPFEVSADFGSPLDDTAPTLAEVLRDGGYATAGFTANMIYTSEASGLSRGFARYEDFPITTWRFLTSSWLSGNLASLLLPSTAQGASIKSAAQVTEAFGTWAKQWDQRPFFAFLNYIDAHGPYESPPDFSSMFRAPGQPPVLVDRTRPVTVEEMEGSIAAYDGAIAYIDSNLGRLFDRLDQRGVLDNTVVVVTSDHGEHFGEHTLMLHANSLYMPLLHVPLILAYPPALQGGLRVSEAVSIRDIPATILDLVGIERQPLGGESLRLLLESPPTVARTPLAELNNLTGGLIQPWDPAARGRMKSLVVGDLHYIRTEDLYEEIYDVERDPGEEIDLFTQLEGTPTLAALRSALDSVLSQAPAEPPR